MERSTVLAILDRLATPNVDEALAELDTGECAIRDLLLIKQQLDAVLEAQQHLAEDLVREVTAYVPEGSDLAEITAMIEDAVLRETLDARISDVIQTAERWTDDVGHDLSSAIGSVWEHVYDLERRTA